MAYWAPHPHLPRAHERPLGLTERLFYWDSLFAGTADTLQVAHVEVRGEGREVIFSISNVENAWTSMKRQFPLLGSRMERRADGHIFFVIEEDQLGICGPHEVEYLPASSAEQVDEFVQRVMNGQRMLSSTQLARIFVIPDVENVNRFCVLVHVSHAITDGVSNTTILRTLFDTLTSPDAASEWILKERLELAVSSDSLLPGSVTLAGPAKQRWRRAINHVVFNLRASRGMVKINSFSDY